MSALQIKQTYERWLNKKITGEYGDPKKYTKLLDYLHGRKYVYESSLDENREGDGRQIRYAFADDMFYTTAMIKSYIDTRKECSLLEMFVGLAWRMELTIMGHDPENDRTNKWFWTMIHFLDLTWQDDKRFDEDLVNERVDRFLYRGYGSDGVGALFTPKHPRRDLREVDIWYQMLWYLSEEIEKEKKGEKAWISKITASLEL